MSVVFLIEGREVTRESLVHTHLPLVKYVVGLIPGSLPPYVDHDDLLQEGIIGLLDAAARFDDSRGLRFVTYAQHRIYGALVDHLRSMAWTTRSARSRKRLIEEEERRVWLECGRAASREDLIKRTGLSARAVDEALTYRSVPLSFDALETAYGADSRDAASLLHALRDNVDISARLEHQERHALLLRALNGIPARQRRVITLLYLESRPVSAVMSELHVSESRVSQIKKQALGKLRAVLGSPAAMAEPAASRAETA